MYKFAFKLNRHVQPKIYESLGLVGHTIQPWKQHKIHNRRDHACIGRWVISVLGGWLSSIHIWFWVGDNGFPSIVTLLWLRRLFSLYEIAKVSCVYLSSCGGGRRSQLWHLCSWIAWPTWQGGLPSDHCDWWQYIDWVVELVGGSLLRVQGAPLQKTSNWCRYTMPIFIFYLCTVICKWKFAHNKESSYQVKDLPCWTSLNWD